MKGSVVHDAEVKSVLDNYPEEYSSYMMEIRELIYTVAKEMEIDSQIEESLKWGQPTYTVKTGTPIRIDKFDEKNVGIFFHCQTTLVGDFRMMFPKKLTFSKNRAIVLAIDEELPLNELTLCIEMALTYHKRKNKNQTGNTAKQYGDSF